MNVRVTLTVGYIWVLAFASNKPYIEFVNASLLHLDDHDLAVLDEDRPLTGSTGTIRRSMMPYFLIRKT